VQEPEEYTPAQFSQWLHAQRDTLAREHRGLSLLDFWESIVNERHRDYMGIKAAREETAARLYHTVQRRLVIEHAKQFFLEAAAGSSRTATTAAAAGLGDVDVEFAGGAGAGAGGRRADEEDMQFKHIAGIIATEDKVSGGVELWFV